MPIHNWTRVDAGIIHDFHHEWISTIKRSLNDGALPPEYYALAEQVAGGLHPDVFALEHRGTNHEPDGVNGSISRGEGEGGIAVDFVPPRVRFVEVAETEIYARKRDRIVIRHRSDDEVIAMIEIVSPGNKSSRHAIRSFVEKTLELLDAGIHLLIVDLFPPGPRDPQGFHGAIWSELTGSDFQLPTDKPLTLAAYSAGDVKTAYVEPAAVGDLLPDMPLFLTPRRYVPVPLESSYRAAWEGVPLRWREFLTSC